jgi:hypothetical protein
VLVVHHSYLSAVTDASQLTIMPQLRYELIAISDLLFEPCGSGSGIGQITKFGLCICCAQLEL